MIKRYWLILLWLPLLLSIGCRPIQRPVAQPVPTQAVQPDDGSHRFDIGGRKLFLLCTGEGSPTVILEAGLGGDHTGWVRVQSEAAKLTRVCSYDRASLGESDPAPTPRNGAAVVADLHSLLAVAGEAGPYVLVGHSFGGLYVRLYAAAYPAEVTGMALVDAVHEDWWRRGAALLPTEQADESALLKELRRYFSSEGGSAQENAEGIDIAATAAAVRQAGGFGTKPLIVLVAGVPDVLLPGLPAALQAPLANLLQQELPGKLVKLSPNSIKVGVPDSGHNIPTTRPDVVVAAIKTLVELSQP